LQCRLIAGAAERLQEMEHRLAPPAGLPSSEPPLAMGPSLVLEAEGLSYAYDAGFTLGPVHLRAHGGEVVIIRGGNGSGKTTLMRTLAGLYPASGGTIRLNGRRITAAELPWYQSHISAIFVDQYLFGAPYGLDADPEEVHSLLERFGLQDVVELREGRFTRTALSSGQRKRLAMVVALLERRPIMILDEWDSHQDPGLRAFYYDTLLPELRAKGMIVLAVSHDERRFDLGDQLLHLEGGQVVPPPERPGPGEQEG
ncbi:MAG TPA: ATP-binding cassette domain-containing protein, partial [Myxococcota bacterium]|nr:ATP-binding cassette domain-containing protein [Myxococcota bacterium]